MKQSLNLKLSQQLTLTPQLKQSLRLLQLSSLDLEQEIQAALDSNPLLDRVENDLPNIETPATQSRVQDNGVPQPVAEAADPTAEIDRSDHLQPEQDLSANWQESFHQTIKPSNNTTVATDTEFTQFVSKQETLFEHVNWQIQMTTLSDKDKLIARTLLHCLDDDGYLSVTLSEIRDMFDDELGIEEDEIAAVLSLIKTLDPIGVGARDLGERLLILLQQLPSQTPCLNNAKQIIEQHLDLLGTRNLAKLKKAMQLRDDELSQSLALITRLNPRIATQFKSDNQDYVIPDIIVSKEENVWVAKLNPDNQSKLRVNETYSDLLNSTESQPTIDKEGSDFIQHNLLEAKMFIKGLMSRYDTLLLVAQAIVEHQQNFFEHGETHMQPMVLQDIANQLEMHESTISRATSGKYLLSARGVVELKYFFSSALSNTDGAASSSTAIRSLIKTMVDAESKQKPLSDSKIAKELEQQGHIVARRTVAKYRESMQIAPSSQRKSLI